jgi:hypothetical protein
MAAAIADLPVVYAMSAHYDLYCVFCDYDSAAPSEWSGFMM